VRQGHIQQTAKGTYRGGNNNKVSISEHIGNIIANKVSYIAGTQLREHLTPTRPEPNLINHATSPCGKCNRATKQTWS
jgi:hypothetical protein